MRHGFLRVFIAYTYHLFLALHKVADEYTRYSRSRSAKKGKLIQILGNISIWHMQANRRGGLGVHSLYMSL
jgi:hypothetical protein